MTATARPPEGTGPPHRRRGVPSRDDTGTRRGDDRLADQLSELALSLQDRTGLQQTLDEIVRAAVGTVPGTDYASISRVIARRDVKTLAATAEEARVVDQAQYDAGEGPCLTALFEHHTIRVSDVAADDRWPDWARRLASGPVKSMLAVQLYVEGQDLGALNLASGRVDAFDDASEHVALLFAPHASVAMIGAHRQEQLRDAINRRDVIGQAKGILMERFKVTGDEAFTLLVRASQRTNRKLHEVADELVLAGDLPA